MRKLAKKHLIAITLCNVLVQFGFAQYSPAKLYHQDPLNLFLIQCIQKYL